VKLENEEIDGKNSLTVVSGKGHDATPEPQQQQQSLQQPSNEFETSESETKGRFKVKNVIPSLPHYFPSFICFDVVCSLQVKALAEDAAGGTSESENKSTVASSTATMATSEMSQSENQEVKGRFKVKNVCTIDEE
jgi:hypothetical protein